MSDIEEGFLDYVQDGIDLLQDMLESEKKSSDCVDYGCESIPYEFIVERSVANKEAWDSSEEAFFCVSERGLLATWKSGWLLNSPLNEMFCRTLMNFCVSSGSPQFCRLR